MAITRTPMIDDDGSGTTGTIINNAWKTEFYNQIDAAIPLTAAGYWEPTAANFSGTSGMTGVPVDQAQCWYGFAGGFVFMSLYVPTSTIAGTPSTQLLITGIPFCNFVSNNMIAANGLANAAGTAVHCFLQPTGAQSLGIVQTSYAVFPAGAMNFGFSIVLAATAI
jgi:hypothetical protein